MKQIRIEAMSLKNFKGIRDLEVRFPGDETIISGANGTGKSTIFDAFTWCLFGKDSRDNQKFNVKTLDANGDAIPQIGHEASVTLTIDGQEHTYTRQLEEQWVKGHGKTETELKGNTTHYYIDGVEMKKSEYEEAVSEIIDETLYKNITNPAYFLNQDKDTQRAQLLHMAGTLTDEEIQTRHPELSPIIAQALQAGSEEMLRRSLKARRDKVRAELDSCPTQIAAIDSVTPDRPDMEALQEDLKATTARIEENERMLADYQQAMKLQQDKRTGNLEQQQRIREAMMKIEHEMDAKATEEYLEAAERINQATSDIAVANNDIARFQREAESEISTIQATIPSQVAIDDMRRQKDELLRRWEEETDKKFEADESGYICPLLKRVCTDPEVMARIREDAQKAKADFYAQRESVLDEIERQGKEKAEWLKKLLDKQRDGEQALSEAKVRHIRRLNELETALNEKKRALEALGTKPAKREVIYHDNPEHARLEKELQTLRDSMPGTDGGTNDTLLAQQRELREKREAIQKLMGVQDTIDKNEAAKQKIRDREKELAQQLADIERDSDALDAYGKIKMTALEERVNAMFQVVRFRMFEKQLNGGEAPACIAMVDGVPYRSDLNTAAKINAGLDIINTMQGFYGVTAPIFIDNAEGINSILETPAQTILLRVTRDKKLKVTNAASE